MIFYHKDEPVDDINKYKQRLLEMRNDYVKKFGQSAEDHRILKTWQENDDIKHDLLRWIDFDDIEGKLRRSREIGLSYNSDDYELIFDLGKGRNPANHYYILFPKDPNSFKVISNLHDRGLQFCTRWIHDEFLKLITYFPKTFELYYGDYQVGFEDPREVYFKPQLTYVHTYL